MSHPIERTLDTFRALGAKVQSPQDRDLIERQITLLEEIRASVGVFGAMGHKITAFEKLISDPWMEDQIAFDRLYASWVEFRDSFAREIGGMTVNERLCYLGLMDEFDRASKSPAAIRSVLQSAFLSRENIEAIITNRRAQPASGGNA